MINCLFCHNISDCPTSLENRAVCLYSCGLLSNDGIELTENLMVLIILVTSAMQFFALLSFWLSNTSTWKVNSAAFIELPSRSCPRSAPGNSIIVMYGNTGGVSDTCEVEKFFHVVTPLTFIFCILYFVFKSSEKSLTTLENTIVGMSNVHIAICATTCLTLQTFNM